ncbi:partial, partial [Paramuricea clavata]
REPQENQEKQIEEERDMGGKIAVRWIDPEAITDITFSTATDIYSYGIALFEMLFPEKPYWNWCNEE